MRGEAIIPAGFPYTPQDWSSASASALACCDDGCGASMAQCHQLQQPATNLTGLTSSHSFWSCHSVCLQRCICSSRSASALACCDGGCGVSMAHCHQRQQPATNLTGPCTRKSCISQDSGEFLHIGAIRALSNRIDVCLVCNISCTLSTDCHAVSLQRPEVCSCLRVQAFGNTVNSLCNNCFGYQENCP